MFSLISCFLFSIRSIVSSAFLAAFSYVAVVNVNVFGSFLLILSSSLESLSDLCSDCYICWTSALLLLPTPIPFCNTDFPLSNAAHSTIFFKPLLILLAADKNKFFILNFIPNLSWIFIPNFFILKKDPAIKKMAKNRLKNVVSISQ